MSQVYIQHYYIGTTGKKQCGKWVFPREFMSQVDGRVGGEGIEVSLPPGRGKALKLFPVDMTKDLCF